MRPRGPQPETTQSVSRALATLLLFDRSRPTRRVSEIALELDISVSSASRLLYTLERFGFVERDVRTREFRLGLELLPLASQALNMHGVYRAALPDVAAVAASLEMTANLAILRNEQLFYLAVVESPAGMTPFSMTGERGPLHATALGAVLLAGMPDGERENLLGRLAYPQFTPSTTSSSEALRAKARLAAEMGYAIDGGESSIGRGCVAAAIRGPMGNVLAAISVTGPMTELGLAERGPALGARMVEIADRISRRLGHRGAATQLAAGRSR